MDRHQFHRGDSEPAQIIDDRHAGKAGIGAAQAGGHLPVQGGKTFDMQLVDHRIVPGNTGRPVILPGKGGIDHQAFRHIRSAIPFIEAKIIVIAVDGITEQSVIPAQLPADILGIGVEQQLAGVETMTVFRLVGAVHPVAVMLSRPRLRQEAVPDLIGLPADFNGIEQFLPFLVEEAKLHFFGMLREKREVNSLAIPDGTKRIRISRPDGPFSVIHDQVSACQRVSVSACQRISVSACHRVSVPG